MGVAAGVGDGAETAATGGVSDRLIGGADSFGALAADEGGCTGYRE